SGRGTPILPPVMLPVGTERSSDVAPAPSRSVGGVWTSTGNIAQPSFVILGAGPAADGLVVARSATNISLTSATEANFALPAGLFRHSTANATLTVEARLSNGRPLPSWLRFDASTGRFSGKPPAGAEGVISIRINVRDDQGREATTDFKVEVRSAVWQPDLSHADRESQDFGVADAEAAELDRLMAALIAADADALPDAGLESLASGEGTLSFALQMTREAQEFQQETARLAAALAAQDAQGPNT